MRAECKRHADMPGKGRSWHGAIMQPARMPTCAMSSELERERVFSPGVVGKVKCYTARIRLTIG